MSSRSRGKKNKKKQIKKEKMVYNYSEVDFSKREFNPLNEVKIDHKLLKKLLSIQSPSGNEYEMIKFIANFIKEEKIENVNVELDEKNNLLVTKGQAELYPCFVCHTDEVNSIQSDRTIIKLNNCYIGINKNTGKYAGVGADDALGVYICIEALRRHENVKVAFFASEEIGCVGSSAVDINFFKDCAFIFQPDRKGNDEVVKYTNGVDTASEEFKDLFKDVMKDYSYKYSDGTSTDVGNLIKRKANCCGFNFGCGYYQPHSLEEKVCISDLENCMNLMFKMGDIVMSTGKKFDYIPVTKTYATSYSRYNDYGGYGKYESYGRYNDYGYWKDEDFYNDHVKNNTKKNTSKKDICIFCEFCRLESCVDCPFVEEKEESSNKDDKN